MDEVGEVMVFVGFAIFICGDYKEVWPISLGLVVVGSILYFVDRAINGR